MFDAGITYGYLAYATALVFLWLWVIHLVCVNMFAAQTSIPARTVRVALVRSSQAKTFYAASAVAGLLQIYLYLNNKLNYMGVQTQIDSYRISRVAALIVPVSIGILLLSGFRFVGLRRRIPTALVIIAQLALIAPQGRRLFVVAVFLTLLGIAFANPSRKLIFSVSLVAMVLVPVFTFSFYILRVASYTVEKNASLVDLMDEARQQTIYDSSTVLDALQENLKSRSFGLAEYVAMLTASPRENIGALGRTLLLDATRAIPSMLLPTKDDFIDEAPEDVAYQYLSLTRDQDEANSLASDFYTDFREPGLVAAIAFFIIWVRVSQWMMAKTRLPFFQVVILAFSLQTCLLVECDASNYMLAIRNSMIFLLVAFAFHLIIRQPHAKLSPLPLLSAKHDGKQLAK